MAFYTSLKKRESTMSGFTLIELLICVSMATIIINTAIPSIQRFREKSHLRGSQILLHASLSLARQTAITTSHSTYICERTDFNTCNTQRPFNADWSKGWLVFVDLNKNGDLDESDKILRIHTQTKPIGIIFNQQGRLRFRSNGSARSAGFYLCNKNEALHILILHSGRTRIKKLTNTDRINKCKQVIN